jgi:alkanesulfonate monooxygenase SsuD/methylene tetrahydromethanopterin reductase-like flavin-dependent oxidoreductase (luciferase family)
MSIMKSYGIQSHVFGQGSPAETYDALLRLGEATVRDGFEAGLWLAQHHFASAAGVVSSPLVALAYLGARVPDLTLGTAVVALSLENPIRLAEDLSTLRTVAGRPVNVGLGSGNPGMLYEAFGIGEDDRRGLFERNLAKLRQLLRGESVIAGRQAMLSPYPAADLDQSLYRATWDAGRAAETAAAGLGLLLSFTRAGATEADAAKDSCQLHLPLIDAYEAAVPAGSARRVAIARSVYVTEDETERLKALQNAAAVFKRLKPGGEAITIEQWLADQNQTLAGYAEFAGLLVGPPDYIRGKLLADPVFARADTVLFQTMPLVNEYERTIESNHRLAREVLVGELGPGPRLVPTA